MPKYIETHMHTSMHNQLHPYLSFGEAIGEKRRSDILALLKSRGLANISNEDRYLIYHNTFQKAFSGLPLDAINEDEYSTSVDLDLVLKSAGFRKDLLARFPLPPEERPEVWNNTMSLLRYVKVYCATNATHPVHCAYWLLEHIFQFPELTRRVSCM